MGVTLLSPSYRIPTTSKALFISPVQCTYQSLPVITDDFQKEKSSVDRKKFSLEYLLYVVIRKPYNSLLFYTKNEVNNDKKRFRFKRQRENSV